MRLLATALPIHRDDGNPNPVFRREELDQAGTPQPSDQGGGRLTTDAERSGDGCNVGITVECEPIEALELGSRQPTTIQCRVEPPIHIRANRRPAPTM